MNPYNLIKNNISLGKSRDEVELRAQMKVVGKDINFITVYLYKSNYYHKCFGTYRLCCPISIMRPQFDCSTNLVV